MDVDNMYKFIDYLKTEHVGKKFTIPEMNALYKEFSGNIPLLKREQFNQFMTEHFHKNSSQGKRTWHIYSPEQVKRRAQLAYNKNMYFNGLIKTNNTV
jgi:hypothetical protein